MPFRKVSSDWVACEVINAPSRRILPPVLVSAISPAFPPPAEPAEILAKILRVSIFCAAVRVMLPPALALSVLVSRFARSFMRIELASNVISPLFPPALLAATLDLMPVKKGNVSKSGTPAISM
jgi:hypothetical protein